MFFRQDRPRRHGKGQLILQEHFNAAARTGITRPGVCIGELEIGMCCCDRVQHRCPNQRSGGAAPITKDTTGHRVNIGAGVHCVGI